jgi:perosamine synthetase
MVATSGLAVSGGAPVIAPGRHAIWPDVREEDKEAVLAVLDRNDIWYGPNGPEILALEQEWASYVGRRYCISTNSGTAALHCAAAAVGVAPGDEVIVPAFTFIATAMAMIHQGATPVFCDVEESTFNIDAAQLPSLITDRTTAIVPVHLHGLMADMDPIIDVARRHGLAVIEDAAQAHGATYHGKIAGSLTECAEFSLNATKTLSGGEGGLFVTDDEEMWRIARRISNFGEDAPPKERGVFRPYDTHGVGWMYRNHEMPAALARSMLRRLNGYIDRARANAAILTEGLAGIDGVIPPEVPQGRTHIYHKYRVRLDLDALGVEGRVPAVEFRDRLVRALNAEGIVASLWQLRPIPAQPMFRRPSSRAWTPSLEDEPLASWNPADYPVASRLLERSIVLGSEAHPLAVQDGDLMERYVDAVTKVLGDLDAVLAGPYTPVESATV